MLKLGLVGLGAWGRQHQRVLQQLHDEGKLELVFAEDLEYGADVDLNLVDAVDFVTPANTHYEQAKTALERGKHVFVEKPMTLDRGEAIDLVSYSEEVGKILAVGHQFRFSWALQQVQKELHRGMRTPAYLTFRYIHSDRPPRTDMGAIFNFGSHLFDMLLFIFGRLPDDLLCSAVYLLGNRDREDAALVWTRYGRDVALLELGWTHPIRARDIWLIEGGRKLYADLAANSIEWFMPKSLGREVGDETELLYKELEHFVFCCDHGSRPINDCRIGADAVLLCEAALVSAKENKVIKL